MEGKCPVAKFRLYVLSESIASEDEVEALEAEANNEVAGAIEFAQQSPWPIAEDVMKYVFSNESC